MTDNLHLDTSRGARAEELLRSELVTEAFDQLETVYVEAWKSTKPLDTEARERLWQAYQIVGKVRSHLIGVAEDGKLAQAELNEIERMGERKKVLGVF